MSVKLHRTYASGSRLRVLHQQQKGAPWELSDEVVHLSADGVTARFSIRSFCTRILVDSTAVETMTNAMLGLQKPQLPRQLPV